jgi:predicted  nucleic acid-binding Zn-ribbon protein
VIVEPVPDAPWWANFMLILTVVAVVPTVTALAAKRQAKRATVVTEEAHAETSEKMDRVLHNVENSHSRGLRDDLDDKIGNVVNAIEGLRRDLGGVHSELRDARDDIGHVRRDVDGIRTEARRDRRRIGNVERNLTTALGKAQGLLELHHPGGTDLLAGLEEDPPDDQL